MSTHWDAASFRDSIQQTLDEFLAAQQERLAPLGADATRLLDEARVTVAGGKRLRAAFCWWGYRAVQPEVADPAALFRACAALELLHASALVHDDVMDDSDTRRGRPATHRAFAAQHRGDGWTGDPEQYGTATAILLGDLLLTWADELLRHSGLPQVGTGLDFFDVCRTEVVAGQFLDVSVQARGRADVATAMTVLRFKSAKYSIERPLHIGAALAGAGPGTIEELTAFGLPLGEAFQLRDDVLGVFGDPASTGKPAGDDLVEGKRTVLIALALESAAAADADLLDRSLGKELTAAEVARLCEVIESSGARLQVESMIDELAATSLAALERSGVSAVAQDALRALAAAATKRDR
ncbi:polyprenyl synthetase family protein [Nocardioides limicola]|uniref:polyprenyl synthetase family protein n=1 Tax=Nocardioides limicola TaxID=2803368 RepID=UPI00193B1A40|nr:polyprenyl synthetase family protein [Nocardioides sp. DJM-14]